MSKITRSSLLVLALFAILIQNTYSRTLSEKSSELKSAEKTKSNDKFAQEVADALDSTFMFLKNGFEDFIDDSNKVNNMLNQFTDRISSKLISANSTNSDSVDAGHQLRQLTLKANKTLMETL